MTEPESGEEATLFPKTAGDKLRDARLAQDLTLAEVAARTRIPMRHLEAIEQSNFSGLPSPTYSVGFAKAYARAVGLDEVMIGREVRRDADASPRAPEYIPYDTSDPSRLPPRGLVTVTAVVAVLVVIGVVIWFGSGWLRGAGTTSAPPPVVETPAPAPAPAPAPSAAPPAAAAGGQVVLTATDVVWLRVYDGAGKTLFQGELKPGDHYDVPADAVRPMINVGRPDKLQVTVNGSAVPPLGNGKRAIKDVEISADALIARAKSDASAPAAGTDGATPTPAASGAGPAPTQAPTAAPPTPRQVAPARPTNSSKPAVDKKPKAVPLTLPDPSAPSTAPGTATGAGPGGE